MSKIRASSLSYERRYEMWSKTYDSVLSAMIAGDPTWLSGKWDALLELARKAADAAHGSLDFAVSAPLPPAIVWRGSATDLATDVFSMLNTPAERSAFTARYYELLNVAERGA